MSTAAIDSTRMDFLGLVESYSAAEASASALYGNEGVSISTGARRHQQSPRYKQGLVEATQLYQRVLSGNRLAALQFQEAMATSDFSTLFGAVLDRQILAAYATTPVRWDTVARRGRVRDFRTVERHAVDGGQAILDKVKELTEYPSAALTSAPYTYKVEKRGRKMGISWEALINDDLDAFSQIPTVLGVGARRSEEYFVTDLFAGASGPDATFFAAGNANIVTSNPTLSITALQTAFQVLAAQVDADGGPIYVEGVTLMVPPALEVTARNIINATEIHVAAGSGGAATQEQRGDRLVAANWVRDRVTLMVNPWLPLISTTANGSTSWYLIADPNMGRPAAEIGFLLGHETPEIFQKAPSMTRAGGGAVGPDEGDFETDALYWKVRHIIGGALMASKSAVASNGTGS